MISRITTALTSRRNQLGDKDKGFTLIELLVVVIIIGILAAIAIPVYMGIQNNAKDSAAKSDLTSAKTAVIAYQTDKGSFPDGTTAGQTMGDLGSYGFTKSDNVTSVSLSNVTSTTFCLTAVSSTAKSFYVSNQSGVTDTAANAPGC